MSKECCGSSHCVVTCYCEGMNCLPNKPEPEWMRVIDEWLGREEAEAAERLSRVKGEDNGDGTVTFKIRGAPKVKGETIQAYPFRERTPREDLLSEASKLITGDRNKTYGSPTQNFQDTADGWTLILRHKLKDGESIEPGEVAAMMVWLKLARMRAQPKRDNWVDIAGYAGCGYEADVESGRIENG